MNDPETDEGTHIEFGAELCNYVFIFIQRLACLFIINNGYFASPVGTLRVTIYHHVNNTFVHRNYKTFLFSYKISTGFTD